ncbi:MAG: hypothetical protein AAGC67_10135 [Myxococcota bacterium]
MTQVRDTIPDHLQREVDAALAFWNADQDVAFDVTGIIDPDEGSAGADGRELRLVLCGGDRCEQRSFRVAGTDGDFRVALVDDAPAPTDAAVVPELDPPPGARRGWIDRALARHDFVVLVFYRGFW